ncbi:hypothetical protein BSPWISOXPB_2895 [uncultured Gammaproteobacteria bacterium]|nr:hypothetical protein BSPWISOXPB_2895 [uncultured Gammaproteobacteria bacterium]
MDYITLESPITGKIWLDRNLGATQAATSRTDSASYGDLYQWGVRLLGTRREILVQHPQEPLPLVITVTYLLRAIVALLIG